MEAGGPQGGCARHGAIASGRHTCHARRAGLCDGTAGGTAGLAGEDGTFWSLPSDWPALPMSRGHTRQRSLGRRLLAADFL